MRTLLTAQDWAHLQEIFGAAVELPSEERGAYLDEACHDDPAMRQRIESLILSVEDDSHMTDMVGRAAAEAVQSSLPAIGGRLGPYEITSLLGRGGMGVVYRAVRADDEYKIEVAIKAVSCGLFTDDLRQRFLRERQILANLDHPNIARLLDGGTTPEGMPYVVMEFVAGKPIDVYCGEHGLGRSEAIRLMIEVTRTVDHAHRHLVVHRDLKPDNILVTDQGEPKLLDFGIAKALDPAASGLDGAKTLDATRLLTPDYASPEQIRGEAITTATDVYQLGILLYLLLTGKRPFQTSMTNLGALEQAICESPPPKPGLNADLDRILLQALEKDPARRYTSAGALAEDLERYLAGYPVNARPASWSYTSGKFVLRHKIGVAAATLVLLLILGFSVGTALLAARLNRERQQAEMQLRRSERVSQLLEDVFGGADPNLAEGKNPTARELLDRGSEEVGKSLNQEPAVQASLYSTLGHIYDNLGVIDRAEDLMQRSLILRRQQYGENSVETAKGLNDVADLLNDRGEYARAEAMAREALQLRESLLGKSSPETAETLNYLAMAIAYQGRTTEAEPLFRRAVQIAEPLAKPHDADLVLAPLHNLALAEEQQGDYAAAEASARHTLELARQYLGENSPDTASALTSLGYILQSAGRHEEAARLITEALAVQHRTLNPTNFSIADTEVNLGDELRDEGRLPEAERLYLDARQIDERAFGPGSDREGKALFELAILYELEGRPTEAEPLLRKSLAIDLKLTGAETPEVINVQSSLARVLVKQGQFHESRELLDSARSAARETDGGKGLDTAEIDENEAHWFVAVHRMRRAEDDLRHALAIDRAVLPAVNPSIAESLEILGGLLLSEGRKEEARPLLTEALAIRNKTSTAGSPSLHHAQELLDKVAKQSK
jgi:serine/threonine-protein kinase